MSFLDSILGNSTSSKNNDSFIARLGGFGQKYTDPLAMIFGDKYTGALTKLADKSQGYISKGMKPFEKIDKTINPVRRFVPGVDQLSDNIAQKPVDTAAIVAGMLASGGALSGAMGGGAGGGAGVGWGGAGTANSGLGVFGGGGAGGLAGVGGGSAGALATSGGITGGAGMGAATEVAQPSIAQLMGKGGFGSMPGMSTGVPPPQPPPPSVVQKQTMGQKLMGGLGRVRDGLTPIDPRAEAEMDPQYVKQLRNQAMLKMGLGMMSAANQGGGFGTSLAAGLGQSQGSFNKDVEGSYQRGVAAREERRETDRQAELDKRFYEERGYKRDRDSVEDKQWQSTFDANQQYRKDTLASLERRAAAKAPGVTMSDKAIDFAAQRLLNGEPANKVLANFGRGAQGAQNITAVQNRLAELAADGGVNAQLMAVITQELSSDARARLELGAREGKIAPRVAEAKNFAQIAGVASQKVPREKFVPVNKLMQMADSSMSDPALAAFKAANVSLINAYAAAVGGGAPTVHDKEAAEKMLSTAMSPEAYQAVVNQLITEMDAALAAPRDVMDEMRRHDTGGGIGHPAPPPASSQGWSITPVQ